MDRRTVHPLSVHISRVYFYFCLGRSNAFEQGAFITYQMGGYTKLGSFRMEYGAESLTEYTIPEDTHSVMVRTNFGDFDRLNKDMIKKNYGTNELPCQTTAGFPRVETGWWLLQEWLQDGWPLSLASQFVSKFLPLLPPLPLSFLSPSDGSLNHLTYPSRLPFRPWTK